MQIEETIKSLFSDVNTLQEGRQPQAGELYRGVKELHDKWMAVHTTMQVRIGRARQGTRRNGTARDTARRGTRDGTVQDTG